MQACQEDWNLVMNLDLSAPIVNGVYDIFET
jgi:hypothetical protein